MDFLPLLSPARLERLSAELGEAALQHSLRVLKKFLTPRRPRGAADAKRQMKTVLDEAEGGIALIKRGDELFVVLTSDELFRLLGAANGAPRTMADVLNAVDRVPGSAPIPRAVFREGPPFLARVPEE
jgi:hypothetical protein